MDEEQEQIAEEDTIIEDDIISRILNNAMPKGIDTETKINEILGIQQ